MVLFMTMIMLILAVPSYATTYYVSKTASNGYAVGSDANNCTQAQSQATPKSTIWGTSGIKVCMAGGDTVYVNEGTYTDEIRNPPGGSASAYTRFLAEPTSATRPILLVSLAFDSGGNRPVNFRCLDTYGDQCSFIRVEGFEFQGIYTFISLKGLATTGYPHHWQLINNIFHDSAHTGVLFDASKDNSFRGGNHLIQGNLFYRTGSRYAETGATPPYGPRHNTVYGLGSNSIVEYNTFRNLANGVAIWGAGSQQRNNIIRYNVFYDIGRDDIDTWNFGGTSGSYGAVGINVPGGGNLVHNNLIYDIGNPAHDKAKAIATTQASGELGSIYNNTIYNVMGTGSVSKRCVYNTKGTLVIKNNICYQAAGGFDTTPGTTLSHNLTTDPSFVDAAAKNFSLQSSSPAFNAGTDVGLPYNSSPDIGAYELFIANTAVITGNTMEVTLLMNGNTPAVPTLAGWSLACTPNPTACPTPTITSVVLKAGSSGTVEITYSGAACSAGQIWGFTYDSTTGATTDSSFPQTFKQELMGASFTATNNCTGSGGPSPPAGLYLEYLLNETSGTNANDTGSAGADGTVMNGGTFASDGSGLVLTANTNQYLAIPYGSGVNPTTQSITYAFWVTPTSSLNGGYVGFPVGVNQRQYESVANGIWGMAIQTTGASTPTEFSATAGQRTRVCVTLNSGTDTATLHINGVASTSAGGVKAYTSYTFAGNMTLGLFDPSTNVGAGGKFSNFKLWLSVESCADDYAAANPSTQPWTGTIAIAANRIYGAKTVGGAVNPLAANNTCVTLPAGGAFAVAFQTDGTGSNPTPIAQALWYNCPLCPSAGSNLAVPDTASADKIEFFGALNETGLLTGAHGANLTGALTHIPGGTNVTADSIPVVDLSLNSSTVNRYLGRIKPDATVGWRYNLNPREQTGVELNSYTPAGGACVIVGQPTASMGR